jgi:putative phage-type endonuclease
LITIKNIKGMSREQWLNERKRGVGGSDVGKVLGVSDWGTAVDVWLEKTGRSAPVEQTEAMWFGNEMEDAVARRYAAETGVEVVRHNFMAFDEDCHLLGNIDRLVKANGSGAPAHQGEVRTAVGLECKTSSQAPWDEVPLHYQAQVQTYMALYPSIQRFDVAASFYGFAKAFKVFEVPRDEEVIASIRERVREFWLRHVVADVPPSPTCEADCKALWKASNPGRKVFASDEVVRWVERLKEFEAHIKELEAEASKAKAAIMAAMEDGEVLVGPDGAKLATWKSNKDSTKTDWEAVAKALNPDESLVAEWTTEKSGARVFRVS